MLEKIAMWGGVAGIAVALIAIIIMCFIKSDIKNIVKKDVILFDQNFEIKKKALDRALQMIDEIELRGERVTLVNDYIERAHEVYNELICVVTDMRVAEEFHSITIDKDREITPTRIANFKLAVRQDIGLSTKHAQIVKRAKNEDFGNANETMMKARALNSQNTEQPASRTIAQQPARRPAPQGQPAQKPVQPNNTNK